MALKLLRIASHEAENQFELSLRQAFEVLEPRLRPPFLLTIPNQQEYAQLNRAILYGILCEPHLAKNHIKHLHGIVTDGYGFFISLIINIVNEMYAKLMDSAKDQLIWVTKEMVEVLGEGFDGLLVCLLRQIVGGDFSDGNLWLCNELVTLFLAKWECLLEEEPLVLASSLYTYLRLLADHCRLTDNTKLEALKRLEIEFCLKVLREQFHLCLKIGRDLIRLLQDLVHVPEFRAIWKDLKLNSDEFKTPGFLDISQLYCLRTSSRYFLLRISPEMEVQLRFLLTHVKLGSQKRYQVWFAKKFLFGPERETLLVDIVRFICCAHHPSNEILQSDILPRWAAIGWLLKSCSKNFIEANVKLALFYDWLFFDERVDNIMNIEPAMLLMVCSIPKYIDITHNLLEHLFLLVDCYDRDHTDIIVKGVSSAFRTLVQKEVVCSMDVLISCDTLSPFLKERLGRFLLGSKAGVAKELRLGHCNFNSASPLSLPLTSCMETPTPSPERQPIYTDGGKSSSANLDDSVPIADYSVATCSPLGSTASESQVDALQSLIQNIGQDIRKSNKMGLKTLEAILFSFMTIDEQTQARDLICPEVLSSRIAEEFHSSGYRLFTPLEFLPEVSVCDDEIGSASALITRTFFFAQHEGMCKMLFFWSKNGFPIGAWLLSYASRLAQELYVAGYSGIPPIDNNFPAQCDSGTPLLTFHTNGYFSFLNCRKGDSSEATIPTSKLDREIVGKLVENAFAAYRCFLVYSSSNLRKEDDASLLKLFISDLQSSSEWKKGGVKFLFRSIFCHLSDISVGKEDIIRLLVGQLDHADLVDMQFEIGLKKFSIFGENTGAISHLIKNSQNWDCLEQHKLWGLLRSELAVSKVQVEKIILEFFYSGEFDANVNAIAVGGLLALCCSHVPTPELTGAVLFLPNNAFQDFAATALATWAASNASMLFDSLVNFSEKLENNNGNSFLSNSSGIVINHSAILWLLGFFNARGMDGSDILSNFSKNISGYNTVL